MGRQEPSLPLEESLGLRTEELILWFAIQNEKANSFPEYRKMTVLSPSASTSALRILLSNCSAVSSWGSADEWCCVKSHWICWCLKAPVLSCLQTTSASHHSFPGWENPKFSSLCCCFSTSVQPSQLIQPAVAGQHSLAFFPWLTEKQVDEGSLFSGPYQDNKAFENSNPPLKDPWGSLGQVSSLGRENCP